MTVPSRGDDAPIPPAPPVGGMTVVCLVEQDGDGGIADVSLRALTFARPLADRAPLPDASPAASASAAPETSAPTPSSGPRQSWLHQRMASAPFSGATMPPGEGASPGAGPAGLADGAAGESGAAEAVAGSSAVGAASVVPAGAVVAVVFGPADSVPIGDLSAYGVADAYAVESPRLAGYAPQAWARALAGLAARLSATAVVAAGTDRGSEVMAHLGAITGLPMAANCVSAAAAGPGRFQIVRHRWAGSLLEDAVLDAAPALLTVAVDAVTAVQAESAAQTSVHAYQPELDDADLLVRAAESAERSAGVSLATARVVVGGGRGVGGPDGFGVLEELAGLLGGVVGVSRVVTSEGWRPHKQQVGQTGTRISPELYLACGISGAIQHMAGCLSAKHIVAVNTDPDAPIIQHADYAVIGDLKQVIPALVAAIRARAAP
jgi:electron transfer flavoprotein alpha subunit